jgi:protein-tyrosine-phosphatase/predicted ATP-grasp superfamily ATP-dependent carboligase
MKALILDADSTAGLETIQSLGRNGCIVDTVDLRPEHSRHRSRFIRRQIELASTEDGAIRELVDLFRTENYDLVVPTTEVSLLEMLSPEIPDDMYQRAVLAPRASVQTALNKQAVWILARRVGVRVPSSEMVSSSSPPPETFPVVLKPVFSKTSTSGVVRDFTVTIARDLNQWRAALGSIYSDIPVQQQQYIAGKGLGVEMLFEHGTHRWAFLHERVHELPLTGGGSSYRVSLGLRDDLVRSATSLLSALHWHGVAMVEFKVTPGGEAYLIEINPRLWGSLALSIDCGVDFPAGLLCLATRQPLPPQPQYRTGYFTRNIYRDIEWFKTNLKASRSDPLLLTKPIISSAFEWLRPLVGKESWDFFCWSDLGVVLGEIETIVGEHWTKCVNLVRRRSRRLYLRHFQQPQVIRKLRGRRINKVLVLCYGNICRSPLAAALAARRFPNTSFSSAGFYPAIGRHSPDFVLAAAEQLGVDLAEHRSNCADAKMIDEADLIVIMDIRNYELLKKTFPGTLEKTLFLGMLLPKPQLEIRDPWDEPVSMPSISSIINCAIEQLGRYLAKPSSPQSSGSASSDKSCSEPAGSPGKATRPKI